MRFKVRYYSRQFNAIGLIYVRHCHTVELSLALIRAEFTLEINLK